MAMANRRRNYLVGHRYILISCYHLFTIVTSLISAFLLRFEFAIPKADLNHLYIALPAACAIKFATFHVGRLQRGWWRYVGIADLLRVLIANLVSSATFAVAMAVLVGPAFPRSIIFIDFLVCFVLSGGGRFAVRVYNEALVRETSNGRSKGVLIYGAGGAGLMLVREIRSNPSLGYELHGFVDDDEHKRGGALLGVPVLGCGRDLHLIVQRLNDRRKRVEEIIIAMPSANGREMREALASCRSARVPCRTLPGMSELLTGRVLTTQIRNPTVGDLLGREPVRLEEDRIRAHIAGKTVLVTGAAGSIGSEICRQVAEYGPERLIALDQAESALFHIDRELTGKFPLLRVTPEIADIRNRERLDYLLRKTHVDTIFHTAAYKHVPLMEAHVLEAVTNNIMGTWNLVQAAYDHYVDDFLMISSDKAVNPSSIMGTTKRVAELIVSSMPKEGGMARTRFVSVRFGNVLGSNGSVVPVFQAQIAAGGPVTVTHPEMRRYFMTIREAVQLVLQASTMGKGSEIFVLDMGEQVKIVDLARNMIRIAGRIPDDEIEIRFTGLRPGEKLYEEISMDGENMLPTYHEKIRIFRGEGESAERIASWLATLRGHIARWDSAAVHADLQALVPEYQQHRRASEAFTTANGKQ
jgi:FlaA1/EpsC-like NDP-sugar epimerase